MILDMCSDPSVLKTMRIVKIMINLIKIIVPIILLVSASITFTKAVTDGNNSKALQAFIRKAIAAVIIFLIPTFVNLTLNLADQDKVYYSCL